MRRVALVAAFVTALATSGCVQRRMTIRSNPPGALVYVDDYQLGATPVSHDFVYYGTRKIRLVKDGYETLTVRQPFPIPWYQYFPLDFVTENLIPWEIRDERVVDLAMAPAASVPPESVVARAEQARLASGSLPPVDAPRVIPLPGTSQPVAAPPPAIPPAQQYAPLPPPMPMQPLRQAPVGPLPPPQGGGLVFPPQPPSPPFQGLQPPPQNAPAQGIPSLGGP
ncbi:MAG: PEGA domain-containing protein, partial [Planctomycetota bacterium]